MFKPYAVHYKNKYPDCQVRTSGSSLDVYSKEGHHLVSLRINGAGQLVDVSEEEGCEERHDLSPIPKESRRFKLYANGMIGKSEEFEERTVWVKEHAKRAKGGYLKIAGHKEVCEWECEEEEEEEEVSAEVEAVKPAKKKAAKKK